VLHSLVILLIPLLRACLSCFGNGNKKADLEGSSRGLQITWIVKIILTQFSLIRGALLPRLQKLETPFLQRTRKCNTSVFASFLGVSILFLNASSAQKNRLYRARSTSVEPTPHQDEAAPTCHKMLMPIIITIPLALCTAGHIKQRS
jgi:hypothetical protein